MPAQPTNWRETQVIGPIEVPTVATDVVVGSGIYIEAVYFVGGSTDRVVTVTDKAGAPNTLYKDTVISNASTGGPVAGPWPADGGISWSASGAGVTGYLKFKTI
jgi:hypothetical protein